MSRGIGPVLLTHFTPDEAEDDILEESAPAADKAESGVLVAPAPKGRSARHRAGRGRRALVRANPRTKPRPKAAADATTQLPLLDQVRNTPKNMRILATTASAVVLIAVGFGMIRPATPLAGTPIPAGPSHAGGMQPGTLPDAALSGLPTTTVPPPSTPVQSSTPPPTHHTTTHAAPPPVATTQNQPIGSGFNEPGQPCSQPGNFSFDSQYHPVECGSDGSGSLTWHEF